MCHQREAFPAGPEVITWQGPGNPAPVSEVVGLKFWRRLGHLPSASLQLGAPAGSGVGEGLTLRPQVVRGVKARAEGARAGRRHSPPGLQAQRRAARAARAAGAQQAWALAAWRQTARQRLAVTPRRPGVTPAGSRGPHRGARASVLTRASAPGSAISPCGTSWRHRANRRPVVPDASKRAGTTD